MSSAMIITNLVFILRGDEVLLAMKKRGLGVGKWNGPGGKVKGKETPEEAALVPHRLSSLRRNVG